MPTSKMADWFGGSALKALSHLGGTKWQTWFVVFVFLSILTTATDQISELARSSLVGAWMLVPFGVLAVVSGLLYRVSRSAARQLVPRADVENSPRPVKVLILFLSPPGNLDDYKKISGKLDDPTLGRKFGTLRWRMPIAAIQHHISRLERVIVMASSGNCGTFGHVKAFEGLVAALLPRGHTLRIETSGEYLGLQAYKGVDFEDPKELIDELGRIYAKLRDDRVKEHDILIDVTGGTKVNTSAAVAFASLVPDRAFQYVSTNTYQVKSFDVTWDLEAFSGG